MAPFTPTLKFKATGLATNIAVLLTYSVTGIVTGLLGSAAPVVGLTPVMVTVPVHVVPEAMLPGVTVMGKLASLFETAAVTPEISHDVPQAALGVMETVAVNVAGTPVLLVTLILCDWLAALFCPV